jgi:hypothetical protein
MQFQADYLDKETTDWIVRQHHANKKHAKAFIQGLGPSGLYSTLQLFMAGFDVVGVDQRSENYTRARSTKLDIKWVEQLSWFLGTDYLRYLEPRRPTDSVVPFVISSDHVSTTTV